MLSLYWQVEGEKNQVKTIIFLCSHKNAHSVRMILRCQQAPGLFEKQTVKDPAEQICK